MPGVANKAMHKRPRPTRSRSSENSSAATGITTHSTTTKNAKTPIALPAKIALRESGATNRPSRADSSRSRCQVLPNARTAANASDSQITPLATIRPRWPTEERKRSHDHHQQGKEAAGDHHLSGRQLDREILRKHGAGLSEPTQRRRGNARAAARVIASLAESIAIPGNLTPARGHGWPAKPRVLEKQSVDANFVFCSRRLPAAVRRSRSAGPAGSPRRCDFWDTTLASAVMAEIRVEHVFKCSEETFWTKVFSTTSTTGDCFRRF